MKKCQLCWSHLFQSLSSITRGQKLWKLKFSIFTNLPWQWRRRGDILHQWSVQRAWPVDLHDRSRSWRIFWKIDVRNAFASVHAFLRPLWDIQWSNRSSGQCVFGCGDMLRDIRNITRIGSVLRGNGTREVWIAREGFVVSWIREFILHYGANHKV